MPNVSEIISKKAKGKQECGCRDCGKKPMLDKAENDIYIQLKSDPDKELRLFKGKGIEALFKHWYTELEKIDKEGEKKYSFPLPERHD